MLNKRFRVVIDVDVTVRDLTLDAALEAHRERALNCASCGLGCEMPIPTAESIERQKRLLDALMLHPQALAEWLRHDALRCIVDDFEPLVPLLDYEPLLKPAIESLPPRERHQYRQAMAAGDWIDMSDELFDTFSATIARYYVVEDPKP